MAMQKKSLNIVTDEIADQLIKEHYSAATEKMDTLLKEYAASNKPSVDVERVVADTIENRKELLTKINYYEDELVRMLDLASVLSEQYRKTGNRNMDEYVNYLLKKNMDILPDIIEIIQFLKK